MARSFDQFPIDDELISAGKPRYLSNKWRDAMATFYQTLIGYITEYGFLPPNLTSAQIATIQAPQNGQIVYNITVDAPQFFQSSSNSWRTLSFT